MIWQHNKEQLKSLVWWCYIDDIFMIWQHDKEQLKLFLEILNPSCKFIVNYPSERIAMEKNLYTTKVKRDPFLIFNITYHPAICLYEFYLRY